MAHKIAEKFIYGSACFLSGMLWAWLLTSLGDYKGVKFFIILPISGVILGFIIIKMLKPRTLNIIFVSFVSILLGLLIAEIINIPYDIAKTVIFREYDSEILIFLGMAGIYLVSFVFAPLIAIPFLVLAVGNNLLCYSLAIKLDLIKFKTHV